MPTSDTNYPASERLKMASQAAWDNGDFLRANELAGAARAAHWQECLAAYEEAKAKANMPVFEVWGGRSLERSRYWRN